MEKQIETLQQQLRQQEKLASLGMLSAGIAHEIQNPLNFVINFSKLSDKLLNDLADIVEDNADKLPEDDKEEVADIVDDLRENLKKISEHGERAISIIRGILLVSRGKENEFIPSNVANIVKEYVWLSYHAMRANFKGFNMNIREHYQEGIPMLMVIPQDLSRAVLNLVNNACYTLWKRQQDAPQDYEPTLDVDVRLTTGDAPSVVTTITDNGEGMTEEVKQHLYENFFTTKPIGQGTGLGMAITRDIIENKHGGTLAFDSTFGKGTSFTITIPARTK
jgi:signal transduction histidine kinase